ncbi:hypothetical protein RRF57_008345 [Xylaria bambusicola]|uniref:Uncharacterized protein n=1 Tax=Xylaria bambusicola TaxID=326684 RepID=A0AAN7ZAX2_9PEZI
METWQVIFITASILSLLVALGILVWFLTVFLFYNIVMLNFESVSTNRPSRLPSMSTRGFDKEKSRRDFDKERSARDLNKERSARGFDKERYAKIPYSDSEVSGCDSTSSGVFTNLAIVNDVSLLLRVEITLLRPRNTIKVTAGLGTKSSQTAEIPGLRSRVCPLAPRRRRFLIHGDTGHVGVELAKNILYQG